MAWVIADRLFISGDFKTQLGFFRQNFHGLNIWMLVLAILLMPLNWLIEVFKWRVLLQNPGVPFVSLVKGVIAGLTVGFVTPGRTGEFIGRVMYMEEENKTKIFYLSTIGGLAQTVVTLAVGSLLISFWSSNDLLMGTAIGLSAGFLLLFFRFDKLNDLLVSIPLLQRYSLTFPSKELPPAKVSGIVLLMALARYAVYSGQYFLLLRFFGLGGDSFILVVNTGIFLLAQTFSPLMPLFDFSFRGATALYVFKNIPGSQLSVLCTVTVVWLINLVIPALVGYIFILRKNNVKAVIV